MNNTTVNLYHSFSPIDCLSLLTTQLHRTAPLWLNDFMSVGTGAFVWIGLCWILKATDLLLKGLPLFCFDFSSRQSTKVDRFYEIFRVKLDNNISSHHLRHVVDKK